MVVTYTVGEKAVSLEDEEVASEVCVDWTATLAEQDHTRCETATRSASSFTTGVDLSVGEFVRWIPAEAGTLRKNSPAHIRLPRIFRRKVLFVLRRSVLGLRKGTYGDVAVVE